MFGHERFEAYQISIKFLKVGIFLADSIPTGYSVVKDQFKRAALSIPLIILQRVPARVVLQIRRDLMLLLEALCSRLCDGMRCYL
jgi:hypothetical protein